jgi:hypothetical protein
MTIKAQEKKEGVGGSKKGCRDGGGGRGRYTCGGTSRGTRDAPFGDHMTVWGGQLK